LSLECCKKIKDDSLIEISAFLTSLQSLNLRGCYKLTSVGISTIAKANSNLKSLNLSKLLMFPNPNDWLQIFPSCPNVNEIILTNCGLTNNDLTLLSTHCTNITSLAIGFCERITDEGIVTICNSLKNSLQYLNLQGLSQITNTITFDISTCNNLTSLDLRDCPRINNGLDIILKNCPNFKQLRLRSDYVTDETLEPISKYGSSIFLLDFQNCVNITIDPLLQILSNLKMLNLMTVTDIHFTKEDIHKLVSANNNPVRNIFVKRPSNSKTNLIFPVNLKYKPTYNWPDGEPK